MGRIKLFLFLCLRKTFPVYSQDKPPWFSPATENEKTALWETGIGWRRVEEKQFDVELRASQKEDKTNGKRIDGKKGE